MKGIGVSPGIAIGRAWVLSSKKERASGILLVDAAAIEREIGVYRTAVGQAVTSLEGMMEQAGDAAEILGVQLELMYDPVWESEVIDRIRRRSTARDAVLGAMEKVMQVFFEMEDAYMRGRAADIQDMGSRLIRMLDGKVMVTEMGEGEWIVVAEDLTPSDTIGLDTRALGFVTQVGGATSHAAIVARLRGIPSVTGVNGLLEGVANGALLALDGSTGVVLVNPTEEELTVYLEKQEAFIERMRLLAELKDREAVTLDGVRIELLANIGTADDMEAALEQGAQGVGLLRTELLFLDRVTLPSEEEQFQFYKSVLLRSGGREVTIRTLDIGGDKPLPYLGLPAEANPFLGYRAIRISLDQPALFLAQLRAILRASVFGKCRIMFPMIGSVEELRKAKAFVAVAMEDLRMGGVAFDASVPVGVMIEIPGAALTADLLAKEADFFSIGTNDLCMYVLAVDRLNQKIAALYDPFHPAVLRLIREVIEQGHGHGIPVGMCGEMAGDPQATELLLEMGLREFSMSAGSLALVKEVILRSKTV